MLIFGIKIIFLIGSNVASFDNCKKVLNYSTLMDSYLSHIIHREGKILQTFPGTYKYKIAVITISALVVEQPLYILPRDLYTVAAIYIYV